MEEVIADAAQFRHGDRLDEPRPAPVHAAFQPAELWCSPAIGWRENADSEMNGDG